VQQHAAGAGKAHGRAPGGSGRCGARRGGSRAVHCGRRAAAPGCGRAQVSTAGQLRARSGKRRRRRGASAAAVGLGGVELGHPAPGAAEARRRSRALTSSSSGAAPPRPGAPIQAPSTRDMRLSQSSAHRLARCGAARPGRAAAHRAGRCTSGGQRQQAPAQRQQVGGEVDQRVVGLVPVDPGDGVVLAVGLLLPLLAVAELVAGGQHRRALRQQHGGQQRALQAARAAPARRGRGGAFPAAVPAQVVAVAVAVVLAVGLVVAQVVADQVGSVKPSWRDDVVDRLQRRAARAGRGPTSRQALRELAARAVAAQPEGARGVAEAVVPLQPAAREAAHLVAAGADVPGLGDQLDAGQHRVLQHGALKKGPSRSKPVIAAAQHRRQVEAEAVDVHLLHPVAQAVHHQLQHARVAHVQRVAAAAPVLVAVRAVGGRRYQLALSRPRQLSVGPRGRLRRVWL
jgi:hypothetical protein